MPILIISQKSPIHTPAILNTVIDGAPALDTFDLIERHPQNPALFQVSSFIITIQM